MYFMIQPDMGISAHSPVQNGTESSHKKQYLSTYQQYK